MSDPRRHMQHQQQQPPAAGWVYLRPQDAQQPPQQQQQQPAYYQHQQQQPMAFTGGHQGMQSAQPPQWQPNGAPLGGNPAAFAPASGQPMFIFDQATGTLQPIQFQPQQQQQQQQPVLMQQQSSYGNSGKAPVRLPQSVLPGATADLYGYGGGNLQPPTNNDDSPGVRYSSTGTPGLPLSAGSVTPTTPAHDAGWTPTLVGPDTPVMLPPRQGHGQQQQRLQPGLLHQQQQQQQPRRHSAQQQPLQPPQFIAAAPGAGNIAPVAKKPHATPPRPSSPSAVDPTPPEGAEPQLIVNKIPWWAGEADLAAVFREAGEVTETRVFRRRATNESRCFGFVYFKTLAEAERAIRLLNGREWNGRSILVQWCRNPRNGPSDESDTSASANQQHNTAALFAPSKLPLAQSVAAANTEQAVLTQAANAHAGWPGAAPPRNDAPPEHQRRQLPSQQHQQHPQQHELPGRDGSSSALTSLDAASQSLERSAATTLATAAPTGLYQAKAANTATAPTSATTGAGSLGGSASAIRHDEGPSPLTPPGTAPANPDRDQATLAVAF